MAASKEGIARAHRVVKNKKGDTNMTKGKQQEYGTVDQKYTVQLQYEQTVREDGILVKRKIEKSIDLDINPYEYGDAFSLSNLIIFRDSCNKLLAETHELLQVGTFIEFEITAAAYERVPEYQDERGIPCTSMQIAFDCWEYRGRGEDLDLEDDEGSLYMAPDTRYTEAGHDAMFPWTKDFMESMAEYHI